MKTLDYNGQPLTLSIPLTATNNTNSTANNLIVIVIVIIVAIVIAAVVSLTLVKRKRHQKLNNLQALKKQYDSKKKL